MKHLKFKSIHQFQSFFQLILNKFKALKMFYFFTKTKTNIFKKLIKNTETKLYSYLSVVIMEIPVSKRA